jgi:hypothetical protein
MKSLYSVLILLIFITLHSGQTQNLFESNNSRWWQQHVYPDASMEQPSFRSTRTTLWGISGDSLIQDTLWRTVWQKEDSVLSPPWNFAGLVHASGEKVWRKDSLGISRLLYDFSLNLGDSAWYEFSWPRDPQYLYVIQEDSVLTTAGYRKRIRFSEPTGPTAFDVLADAWIEGIGSIRAPLFPANPRTIFTEMSEELFISCAGTDSFLLWQSPDAAECYKKEVLSAEKLSSAAPLPYPNPFTENIRWNSPSPGLWTYSLFSLNGQRIAHGESIENEISLSGINSGTYLLLIAHNEGLYTFRIRKE